MHGTTITFKTSLLSVFLELRTTHWAWFSFQLELVTNTAYLFPISPSLKTRFGPNRVAADMEENGEFDFWVIYEDFLRYFGEIKGNFGNFELH